MKKDEVRMDLEVKGYTNGYKITNKKGGLQLEVIKRIPMYEFDLRDFLLSFPQFDKNKIHHLDPWTITIECED